LISTDLFKAHKQGCRVLPEGGNKSHGASGCNSAEEVVVLIVKEKKSQDNPHYTYTEVCDVQH